jgi:hypothetical protein
MAITYKLIASHILTSTATNVTFSSLPTTYKDFVIKGSTKSDGASVNYRLDLKINNLTTAIYNRQTLSATSVSLSASSNFGLTLMEFDNSTPGTTGTNTFSNFEIYIPVYNSSVIKPLSAMTVIDIYNNTNVYLNAFAGQVRDANPITSINLAVNSVNFVAGSSFFLYGI